MLLIGNTLSELKVQIQSPEQIFANLSHRAQRENCALTMERRTSYKILYRNCKVEIRSPRQSLPTSATEHTVQTVPLYCGK